MILQNIRSDDIWMNRFCVYSLSHFVLLLVSFDDDRLDDSMLFRFIKVGSCQCAFASVKLKDQDKDFASVKLEYQDIDYFLFANRHIPLNAVLDA